MRAWLLVLAACGSTAKPKPAPPAASCEDATRHYETAVDLPKEKAHAPIVKRCTDDGWTVEARNCFAKTQPLDDMRECLAKLAPPQRDALDREIAFLKRPPPPPPSTLTPCEQYAQRIEHIMGCDKLPQASRDALKQAFDAMTESMFAIKNETAEVQASMQEGCKAGVEALDSVLGELCPP